jgi:hypothetical protein
LQSLNHRRDLAELGWRPPHLPQIFAPWGSLVPQLTQNRLNRFDVFPALVVAKELLSSVLRGSLAENCSIGYLMMFRA